MSILNVEHLTHGFGDRAVFEDVSFRLLKGEHSCFFIMSGDSAPTCILWWQYAAQFSSHGWPDICLTFFVFVVILVNSVLIESSFLIHFSPLRAPQLILCF